MKIQTIDVYDLAEISHLTPTKCADLSEAAAVCLDYHQHKQEVMLTIEGDLSRQFKLVWKAVSQQMRDSRNDLEYAVEDGAYCLAMMIVEKLTNLTAVKQSKKRSGFDYWIGDVHATNGVQKKARLEVSGILRGTKGQINYRLKEKIKQTKQSDDTNFPAYVVIVEFSHPLIKIIKR